MKRLLALSILLLLAAGCDWRGVRGNGTMKTEQRPVTDFTRIQAGGFYEIPLNSMIQWRSPAGERARILATQNFISFAAILWASVALYIMGTLLELNPAQVLFAVGVMTLAILGIFALVSAEARAFFVKSFLRR